MKNLLLSLVLLAAFCMVSCEKSNEKLLKKGSCAPCETYALQNPTTPLTDGITKKVIVDLVPTATGYYSEGLVAYYQDGKEIASVSYKEKEGKFIGIKKTYEDSDVIPAHNDIGAGSCVPNVPTRTTTCCEFQQTAVK